MKGAPFHYHRAETLEEALALLNEYGDDGKVLSGGQSLIPLMSLRLSRPAHVIDIGRVSELRYLGVNHIGGISVGAGARHVDVERAADVVTGAPLVSAAMPLIGHLAIRNRGTVCGSLAHADPAAELPAVVVALDAELTVRSVAGERMVAAADFFHGYLESDVAENEVLTEVRFPTWPASAGASVREVCRRHGDFALVGLACVVKTDGGRIDDARLSFFGAASLPVRATEAEALLRGQAPSAELFEAAAASVSAELDPPADNHGSAAYRRHVAGVLTRQCLQEAVSRVEVNA